MVSEHVLFYEITPLLLTRTREYFTTVYVVRVHCSIVTGSSATEHMLSPAQTVCLLQTTPPPLPLVTNNVLQVFRSTPRRVRLPARSTAPCWLTCWLPRGAAAIRWTLSYGRSGRGRARPPPFAARYDRRIANLLWNCPWLVTVRGFCVSRDRIVVVYVLGRAPRSRWVSAF